MADTPTRDAKVRDRKVRRLFSAAIANLPTGLSNSQLDYLCANLGKVGAAVNDAIVGLLPTAWLDCLVQDECKAHLAFFGQKFDLSLFAATLKRIGEDRISQWNKLGFEPHFFPEWRFMPDTDIPGWKVKPEDWFWQNLALGNLKRRNAAGELVTVIQASFDGQTLLVDRQYKPSYDNGRQMFANDALIGGVIAKLRKEGKIARYEFGLQESRFGISSREWEEYVRPALDSLPEFKGFVNFRLESVLEANSIPQMLEHMPRRKDGQTNVWIWYEEYIGGASHRLSGGNSDYGRLADVSCTEVDFHWRCRAVRPVGVLDSRTV